MIRNCSEIIKIIMELKKGSTDRQVSDLLGISPTNLANYKKKEGSLYENLIIFCERENISIDWLLAGKGPMTRAEAENVGQETPYPLEINELLAGAKRVLLSGNKEAAECDRYLLKKNSLTSPVFIL